MNDYRVDFIFEDAFNGIGWSERWWTTAANADAAGTAISAYWTLRRAITCDQIFIRFIRVSNVDSDRDSLFEPIPAPPNNKGSVVTATDPMLGYDEALLIRRDADTNDIFSHLYLHGLPASIKSINRRFDITGAPAGWAAAFAALTTAVTAAPYQLRTKTAAGPPAVYAYPTCQSFVPIRLTTHKVGRPFDPIRGKRRIA